MFLIVSYIYVRSNVNLNSPAIIFSNTDLSGNIQSTLTTQLYLTSIISASQFDENIISGDGYYISDIYANRERILVLRDLQDYTNRAFADVVVFFKNGLASVLCNRYGPPGKTFTINNLYLNQLFTCAPCCPDWCCGRSIFDMFVGEMPCFNFDQFLPSPLVWPPNKPLPQSSF
jgi:hypothetical protein